MTVLTIIIGVALILFGLYRAIVGFIASRGMGGGWFDVLFGLVNVVLGFLFCIYPVGSMISLTYVFVVLFIFKSIRVLIFAINMVRAKFGHYWFDLVMSIIMIALAVFFLVKGISVLSKKKETQKPAPPAPPADIQLLTEIRDLLKENKG